jgi:hypothetical protein
MSTPHLKKGAPVAYTRFTSVACCFHLSIRAALQSEAPCVAIGKFLINAKCNLNNRIKLAK